MRRETVEAKEARAAEELKNRRERTAFTADKQRYLGRQIEFDLPAPITVDRRVIRSVRIRYGVGLDFLGNLSNHPLVEEPIQEVDGNMRTAKERTTTDGCQRRSKTRPLGGAKVGHLAPQAGNGGRA
ncbi:hypothetical protein [Novosphingobium resinovorum]|nr:hypothetical protein [Novosphingobium resinovorum]